MSITRQILPLLAPNLYYFTVYINEYLENYEIITQSFIIFLHKIDLLLIICPFISRLFNLQLSAMENVPQQRIKISL